MTKIQDLFERQVNQVAQIQSRMGELIANSPAEQLAHLASALESLVSTLLQLKTMLPIKLDPAFQLKMEEAEARIQETRNRIERKSSSFNR